jgi:hypothetical protein
MTMIMALAERGPCLWLNVSIAAVAAVAVGSLVEAFNAKCKRVVNANEGKFLSSGRRKGHFNNDTPPLFLTPLGLYTF